MNREKDIKELLISNTIRVIANGGFEKATTKELTRIHGLESDLKINEVYIYRIFGNKEKLFEAAFLRLDEELFSAFREYLDEVAKYDCDRKERFFRYFLLVWNFVMGDEDKCRCYMRYCYSVYFKGNSERIHSEQFENIVNSITPYFKAEVSVSAILHSVFAILLDFATRAYNGQITDDEATRSEIFNTLYITISPYLKSAAEQ